MGILAEADGNPVNEWYRRKISFECSDSCNRIMLFQIIIQNYPLLLGRVCIPVVGYFAIRMSVIIYYF